jgi:hypothetical protein
MVVWVYKMVDQEPDEKDEALDTTQKAVRQVIVSPLDAPPPSGQQQIHPRRPAPIVPTREERTRKQPNQNKREKKPESE